ncbi:hypothetical protein GCM10022200_18270 [Microbacterium awajiense]|uniref:Glycosyl transferase family 1 domain-containing protein n=1 Tax=Microbacterium awajiense TaxID=415214 RepID=A0ABP7ALW9_9MICO
MTGAAPVVLHLEHTGSPGGAEFALVRMLRADPAWDPRMLVPPGAAGFFRARASDVEVAEVGSPQPAGVSGGGARAAAGAAGRLLVQAAAVRRHPWFRAAGLVDANTARAAAFGALAVRGTRMPFVVHLRDLVDATALGGFGFRTMTRLVLPRADGVIANSPTTLDSALPFVRDGVRTAVIPSASGLTVGRARSARVPGPVRIGMLARIDPWKGQLLLLEAFASALGDSDAVLEFAGAPLFGHEDFLAQLRSRAVELGVANRVRFLGQVDDVDAVLDGWDIAVQYSTRPEPLGQNVLQYLAAGCAVVVADEGGPAEWVDDDVNGRRVSPRDAVGLASALGALAEDGQLRRRLGAAAAQTPELLDDAAVAAQHADFYTGLLATGRR